MSNAKRILWPLAGGLLGILVLFGIYIGVISLAEGPQHALELFWEDRYLVLPILIGFGVQVGLYIILKKRLFVPVANTGPSGALTGVSGTTSTLTMLACCAHHVTDVLPIVGLTAAAAFLARYKVPFMILGLTSTLVGIAVMLVILFRERRKAIAHMAMCTETNQSLETN